MSILVTFNGSNYIIPSPNEVGWGSNLDSYFVAIAAGCLQKTGGNFTLSAETSFGPSFGLRALYFTGNNINGATAGAFRLGNNEVVSWRNMANTANLDLTVNSSNQLTFNGIPLESSALTNAHILVGNVSNIATDVPMSGDITITNTGATTIGSGVVTGTKIASDTITNTNINSAAAIAYSKLALSNSIVNADINSAAGIVYSKLSLSNSIVNADINSAAAIAYSKLATLTVARVVQVNGATGFLEASATTNTELGYLSGVTSAIQTQLNSKATDSLVVHLAGTETITGAKSFSSPIAIALLNQSSIEFVDAHSHAITFGAPDTVGAFNYLLPASAPVVNGAIMASTTGGQMSWTSTILVANGGTGQSSLTAYNLLAAGTTSTGAIQSIGLGSNGQVLTSNGDGVLPSFQNVAGTGTVNSGTQFQLAYYATSTNAVSGLTLITASRALASDTNGLPVASVTTSTELSYVNGVTSAIQTQLNARALDSAVVHNTGNENVAGIKTFTTSGNNFSGYVGIGSGGVSSHILNMSTTQNDITVCSLYNQSSGTAAASRYYFYNGTNDALMTFYGHSYSGTLGGVNLLDSLEITATAGSLFLRAANSNSIYLVTGTTKALTIDSSQKATFNGSIAFNSTSTQGIVGTTTNDSAVAGNVGETISSSASSVSFAASGSFSDLTSISLTAGDWLVSAIITGSNSVLVTTNFIGISTTSGNSSTGLTDGDNLSSTGSDAGATSLGNVNLSIPNYRISLSGTTTVYLKYKANYTSTTPTASGRISAVRIR